MFNDKYGLTRAVLSGQKTMTRRTIKCPKNYNDFKVCQDVYDGYRFLLCNAFGFPEDEILPTYKIGEVVAIAQNYKDAGWDANTLQEAYVKTPTIFPDLDEYEKMSGIIDLPFKYHKGWSNKMFVKADLMPHAIEITDIKVERLQDISEEDCLREGIYEDSYLGVGGYTFDGRAIRLNSSPRGAFAVLIDKVSGKGTWKSNPWAYAYEFKLVK